MDGQTKELEDNKNLLRKFFLNIFPYLKDDSSEIHITHKTIEPFSWWGVINLAEDSGLFCHGAVIFDR